VSFVDPYSPSFYGFLDATAWVTRAATPEQFALGKPTAPFVRVIVPEPYKALNEKSK
jgi:hypothetical protein